MVVRSEGSRLYENALIRAALESLGASLAADHVTKEALEQLEELNQQLAESTDEETAQAANRRFHFRIYELTESPVLLAQLNLLWRTLGSGPHVDRPIAESVRHHAEIIEALRARDGDRAAAATTHHILEAHQGMAP
jgi:DNA-binding GntR family transcriptional regulator